MPGDPPVSPAPLGPFGTTQPWISGPAGPTGPGTAVADAHVYPPPIELDAGWHLHGDIPNLVTTTIHVDKAPPHGVQGGTLLDIVVAVLAIGALVHAGRIAIQYAVRLIDRLLSAALT
jgi:hypothetical protein